jgi:hypothetical protein
MLELCPCPLLYYALQSGVVAMLLFTEIVEFCLMATHKRNALQRSLMVKFQAQKSPIADAAPPPVNDWSFFQLSE